jgi:type IV fimbrial biogenesis protein FimT
MNRQNGLTLTELLITLTLMSILIGIALPGWNGLIARSRLAAGGNEIIGLIMHARSEGIGKAPVLICASGTDCSQFGTAHGVIAILDHNDNRRFDAGDEEIGKVLFDQDVQLRWRSFRNQPHLRLDTRGTVYHQNGHIMLCRGEEGLKVIISWLGRFRSERHPPNCQ